MGSSVPLRRRASSRCRSTRPRRPRKHSLSNPKRNSSNTITTAGRDDRKKEDAMGRKKKRKDKGALEYVSVKNRKKVKALIRELGLEFVSVEKVEEDRHQT